MSQVMITCPDTGEPAYTGLNLDWFSLDALDLGEKTFKCARCGKVHAWTKPEAFLRADGGGD